MRIDKKSDLPKWFDIEKYNAFHNINDNDLLNQLIVRRDYLLYGVLSEGIYLGLDEYRDIMEKSYTEIFSNVIRPLSSSTYHRNKMKTKKYSDMQLSSTHTVTPLQLIDIKKLESPVNHYINQKNIKNSLRGQRASVNKLNPYSSNMMITLDMDNPDEILLDDIKKLLLEWRKELKFDSREPCGLISSSWDVVKRKILEYKIIPIIDLMCWSNIMNKRITNKKIAQFVFIHGEYDSTNIAQTIKPFIENLMSDFSIEKYQRSIR